LNRAEKSENDERKEIMSRISRLIATVGSLAATLLLGVASGQTSSKTESKTWEVIAVQGNTVVAKGPDGTKEYNLPPDFKMDMDGKPIAVSDLKPGMTVHATITTKVSSHPVITTEVKNGEVMSVRGYTVIMKTDKGYQQFSPEKLKSGDVMLFKDGQEIHLSELKKGDVVSAMIVTRHPPTMVTERQINATAKAAPKKEAPAMASSEPSTPAPTAEAAPAPAPEHKALPKTGSDLPLVGLAGFLALAAGAGLTAVRRSR
jgi:LPXTG-motif cell wall-anchored protein